MGKKNEYVTRQEFEKRIKYDGLVILIGGMFLALVLAIVSVAVYHESFVEPNIYDAIAEQYTFSEGECVDWKNVNEVLEPFYECLESQEGRCTWYHSCYDYCADKLKKNKGVELPIVSRSGSICTLYERNVTGFRATPEEIKRFGGKIVANRQGSP